MESIYEKNPTPNFSKSYPKLPAYIYTYIFQEFFFKNLQARAKKTDETVHMASIQRSCKEHRYGPATMAVAAAV